MTDEAMKNVDAVESAEEGQAAPATDATAAPQKNAPARLVGPYWTMEEY